MTANDKWKQLSAYQQSDVRERFNKYAYSALNNPPKESIYIPIIPRREPWKFGELIPNDAPLPVDSGWKRAEYRLRRNPMNPDDKWYDLYDIY